MATTYSYSGATYLVNQLAAEVNASSITTGTLQYINGTGATGGTGTASLDTAVTITFDNALSAGDKTTLDTTVTNHVPVLLTDTQAPQPNLLANGGFDFFQRQAPGTLTTIAQDAYGPDRWRLCRASASVQTQRVVSLGLGISGFVALNVCRVAKITNATKYMMIQILDGAATSALASRTVTFQCKMGCVVSPITVRMGLIQLTSAGTVDTWPANTVPTTWGASSTDPTLATNLAYIGTPVGQSVTTTASKLFSFTATLPSNAKNVAVALWLDVGGTGTDLYVSEAQLILGSHTQDYFPPDMQRELDRCQRYCVAYGGVANELVGQAIASSTTAASLQALLPVPLRASPTITISANADWSLSNPGVAETALNATPTVTAAGQQTIILGCAVALGLVQAHIYQLIASSAGGAGAASKFILSAEL